MSGSNPRFDKLFVSFLSAQSAHAEYESDIHVVARTSLVPGSVTNVVSRYFRLRSLGESWYCDVRTTVFFYIFVVSTVETCMVTSRSVSNLGELRQAGKVL